MVLFILSILLAVLIPRIGAGFKRMEDREFLQEFIQTLKRARLIAMNSGEVVVFRIRGGERLYDLELPPKNPIPDNVDIYAEHLDRDPDTNDHIILFYPDGSLTGSDVQIVFDKERSFYIAVNPLSGIIQLSKTEPR